MLRNTFFRKTGFEPKTRQEDMNQPNCTARFISSFHFLNSGSKKNFPYEKFQLGLFKNHKPSFHMSIQSLVEGHIFLDDIVHGCDDNARMAVLCHFA